MILSPISAFAFLPAGAVFEASCRADSSRRSFSEDGSLPEVDRL